MQIYVYLEHRQGRYPEAYILLASQKTASGSKFNFSVQDFLWLLFKIFYYF